MILTADFFKQHETGVDIPTFIEDIPTEQRYTPIGKGVIVDGVLLMTNEVFVLNRLALAIFGDERRWIDLYLNNGVRMPGTHYFGEPYIY